MRILIADDHELVKDTIALFLAYSGVGEVSKAASLEQAVDEACSMGCFDLVLLDYNMPGMNGLEGLARMREANCGRPVAILSGTASPTVAREAINSGAAGFLPKTLSAESMVHAIRLMAAGEVYIPYDYLRRTEAATVGNLTPRETEVLRALCAGKANKEIALDLELQEVTVKLHVKTLCRKLGARNRTQAAMIARDREMI